MAAIQWERSTGSEWAPRPTPPRRPLGLVTAPPSRRRPARAVYRRRRLAVVLVVALVVSVGSLAARWATSPAAAGSAPATPVTLVAAPGDSYWTLADRLDLGGDLRSVVDTLVRANGGRDLRAGDRIVLDR